LLNFIYDENLHILKALVRNSLGDAVIEVPATLLLKAFGMTQKGIRDAFSDDLIILDTLSAEKLKDKDTITKYNHDDIVQDPEIMEYRSQVEEFRNLKESGKGSPIDTKLKHYVVKYEDCLKEINELTALYDKL
jgi:DNA-directed RNA polymerase beta subunit